MSDEQEPQPGPHIPSHLFRGRVRTSTLVLCLLWLGMWVGYLYLNQPEDAPPQSVVISNTPYVPYVPPADAAPTHQPTPTTTVPTETPAGTTTPGAGTTTTPGGSAPQTTVTTTDGLPFDLPRIPGLPGFDSGTDSEQTGESGP